MIEDIIQPLPKYRKRKEGKREEAREEEGKREERGNNQKGFLLPQQSKNAD